MIEHNEDYHAALASVSRRQVLGALLASAHPMDASAIAAQLGLHVTTVRFHLDQLTTIGLVERQTENERRRGRPRVLYMTGRPLRHDGARDQLIQVLSAALARAGDPKDDAVGAGRRWADVFSPLDRADPLPGLMDVLDQLGFDPRADRVDETIHLLSCPFREPARAHPEVVCAVHRGLIDKLLEDTSYRPQLIPFVEPELCVVAMGGHHPGDVSTSERISL